MLETNILENFRIVKFDLITVRLFKHFIFLYILYSCRDTIYSNIVVLVIK